MTTSIKQDLKNKILPIMNKRIRPLSKKRKLLNDIRKEYGFSEEELRDFMLDIRKSEL